MPIRRCDRLTPLYLIVLLAAVGPWPVEGQLTPLQVTRLESVTSTALSGDGRLVAFTLSSPRTESEDTVPGRRAWSELWVVAAAGGEPRAVIRRPETASSPAWSADGSRLGFVHEGQVWSVPAAGGEAVAVTSSITSVGAFSWSPDGGSVAYTAVVPQDAAEEARRRRGDDAVVASERDRPVRLWIQSLGGGEPRAVTPEDRTVRAFVWAPDSRRLAIQMSETSDADADLMHRRLYVVPAAGGSPQLVAETEGKLGGMAWSPDGTRLAWLGATSLNDPLAQSVFVASQGGGAVNLTPGLEGSALQVDWRDDRTVRFIAAEGTKTALNEVPAAGGATMRVLGHGPEIFQSASFSGDGGTFATAASTATHPGEVYVGDTRQAVLRRVTDHNPWLADVVLGRQETVSWAARDGWRIEGVLIHPTGAAEGTRSPLAVLPHGGPEGISLDGWVTSPLYPAQVLAGAGYAVFMPNYRGSGGRGVAFSKGDHRDLGGREFDDVLDGIDHLEAIGVADAGRVGISGTSYGGYFSAWAGTKHSDRFRLAMPFAGISNWMSFTGTTDIPYEMSIVHWDLWPFEHPLLMWERSPMAHVDPGDTPMVIGHGLADERVHPEQMIQLHQALELNGVTSELVLYPREPHGLVERQHQLDYMRRILEAFDRWVKPVVAPISQ